MRYEVLVVTALYLALYDLLLRATYNHLLMSDLLAHNLLLLDNTLLLVLNAGSTGLRCAHRCVYVLTKIFIVNL